MTTLNQIRLSELRETQRTNRANEAIKQQTVDETKRTNLSNEDIKRATLEETIRNNLATLSEKERANKVQEQLKRLDQQLAKHNLSEEIRHNLESEKQAWTKIANDREIGVMNATAAHLRAVGSIIPL